MIHQIFKVTFIMGTRPEIIKLAPLIIKFKQNQLFNIRIILTGQHKEMALDIMNLFELKEDNNLSLMKENQSLTHISTETLKGLKEEFSKSRPDLVIVQGDTTSAFIGALAAFYDGINIGHVEAGLRTNDLMNPYPEEANRRLISQIATLHFAPTSAAANNLKSFGITKNVSITGNTVIDSMKMLLGKKKNVPEFFDHVNNGEKLILLTVHRRENWGQNLINILKAVEILVEKYKDLKFIIPMHKNKNIRDVIKDKLSNNAKVILSEPLPYDQFVYVLDNVYLILTDSGGIQEEAPSFSKPVLVLRETTEREEALQEGTALLIGTKTINILKNVSTLIENNNSYQIMTNRVNPFGDGNACERILNMCIEFLKEKDS